jgi:cell fate regulator YaaT (PSP1 superfamily)
MAKYVIRFGSMRRLGVFQTKDETYLHGTRVIVRTDRGLEAGEVLCEATDPATEHLKDPVRGPLLRAMSPSDENEVFRLLGQARREFEVCQQHVARLGLEMSLVDVEHIFGGERIIVYYLAENRVDFRELVKSLAGEFQTRIEMRQIGVRDEAKLLADYGDCGKPVCCTCAMNTTRTWSWRKPCRPWGRTWSRAKAAAGCWHRKSSPVRCWWRRRTRDAC